MIEKQMMKGATPVKQNQGTNAREQKIILAMPKLGLTEYTDLHGIYLVLFLILDEIRVACICVISVQ